MEALLHQSRAMCPFLHKTSPATLRSLSTSTAAHSASTGGGSMSNLQLIARRCPVMGKALAVQSARTGNTVLAGAFGGTRAYHAKVGHRARLHTSSSKEAQAVDVASVRRERGTSQLRSRSAFNDVAMLTCGKNSPIPAERPPHQGRHERCRPPEAHWQAANPAAGQVRL